MSDSCVDHIVKMPRVFTPELDVGTCCEVDMSNALVVVSSVGAWVSDAVRAVEVSKGLSVGCSCSEEVVDCSRGAVVVVADGCGICVDGVSVVDETVGTAG